MTYFILDQISVLKISSSHLGKRSNLTQKSSISMVSSWKFLLNYIWRWSRKLTINIRIMTIDRSTRTTMNPKSLRFKLNSTLLYLMSIFSCSHFTSATIRGSSSGSLSYNVTTSCTFYYQISKVEYYDFSTRESSVFLQFLFQLVFSNERMQLVLPMHSVLKSSKKPSWSFSFLKSSFDFLV